MALKTSNKNRKKDVLLESIVDVGIDVHEKAFTAITELADLNKDITKRNVVWSAIGVAVGIALLVFVI